MLNNTKYIVHRQLNVIFYQLRFWSNWKHPNDFYYLSIHQNLRHINYITYVLHTYQSIKFSSPSMPFWLEIHPIWIKSNGQSVLSFSGDQRVSKFYDDTSYMRMRRRHPPKLCSFVYLYISRNILLPLLHMNLSYTFDFVKYFVEYFVKYFVK